MAHVDAAELRRQRGLAVELLATPCGRNRGGIGYSSSKFFGTSAAFLQVLCILRSDHCDGSQTECRLRRARVKRKMVLRCDHKSRSTLTLTSTFLRREDQELAQRVALSLLCSQALRRD